MTEPGRFARQRLVHFWQIAWTINTLVLVGVGSIVDIGVETGPSCKSGASASCQKI